jgi:RNA polymerase sigma-70 factor (ECF subfamily)
MYLREGLVANPWGRDLRLLPIAANHQPALALYAPAEAATTYTPFAVKVLTVHGDLISAITGFVTPHLFPAFGLPTTVLSARVPGSA